MSELPAHPAPQSDNDLEIINRFRERIRSARQELQIIEFVRWLESYEKWAKYFGLSGQPPGSAIDLRIWAIAANQCDGTRERFNAAINAANRYDENKPKGTEQQ